MEHFFMANDDTRVLILAGEYIILTFEIPKSPHNKKIKLIERDWRDSSEITTDGDKDHLKVVVDDAKQNMTVASVCPTYSLFTPSGASIILEKADVKMLDLVLNESDDDVIFEIMAKDG